MAALFQTILLVAGLLMAVPNPAASEPCQHSPAFATTVSAPWAHDAADHAPAAACPQGMAPCWSHCSQVPPTAFTLALAAPMSRAPFIRDITYSAQDGPTRLLPPPKLFS
jgi:hypothetical protein